MLLPALAKAKARAIAAACMSNSKQLGTAWLRYAGDNHDMVELPRCQHAGACGITFADGHAEIHQWRRTFSHRYVTCQRVVDVPIAPSDPDLNHLARHTPLN